jgi:hypothetical protein
MKKDQLINYAKFNLLKYLKNIKIIEKKNHKNKYGRLACGG